MHFFGKILAVGFLFLGLSAQAHEYKQGGLEILHPHTLLMQAQNAAQPLGIFMTIKNETDVADRLISASVPEGRVEMHTMSVDDKGVMQMRQVDGFDIPANGTKVLSQMSDHIMLLDAPKFELGKKYPMTLVFEKSGTIQVEISADPLRDGDAMDHEHHHD